ncbi:hypothetical protein BDY21DRAFT_130134 [Lineolata rhizophorae]|uniref:Uncharacterized protein n=1 Tax=Lineolata rhizophorae TaxID=578093 RepID=A0A6A6NNU3_9PEZI|nr:hypothetical protein BDY21DRAFT_130134 [Lineolata rhizophorae]
MYWENKTGGRETGRLPSAEGARGGVCTVPNFQLCLCFLITCSKGPLGTGRAYHKQAIIGAGGRGPKANGAHERLGKRTRRAPGAGGAGLFGPGLWDLMGGARAGTGRQLDLAVGGRQAGKPKGSNERGGRGGRRERDPRGGVTVHGGETRRLPDRGGCLEKAASPAATSWVSQLCSVITAHPHHHPLPVGPGQSNSPLHTRVAQQFYF